MKTPELQPAPTIARSPDTAIWSFVKTVAFIAVLFVVIRGTIIAPYKIPSGSMRSTLEIGDHIFVSKLSYGLRFSFVPLTMYQYSTPERNDIVVFTRDDEPQTPEDESQPDIIKRVIGLPGESVEVRGQAVLINGTKLDEPFARWENGGVADFGPAQVPSGHVLLLGDNRDQSKDSRFWANHFLEIGRIKGRALIIYWSFDDFGRIGTIVR